MKNILSRFGKISLLLALIYFVVGCDDDKEDVAPGLYVMSDEIETFPGDTVLDRKSTRLNSSHIEESRMPSSA